MNPILTQPINMPFTDSQDMKVMTGFMNKAKMYFEKNEKTFVCGIYIMDRKNNPKNIYHGNFIFTNADPADLETATLNWLKRSIKICDQ